MTVKQRVFLFLNKLSAKKVAAIAMLALAIMACGGLYEDAHAANPQITLDASCNAMNTYGFTAGVVYCVQATIGKAVATFVPIMQGGGANDTIHMRLYEGMAAAVAIALFGMKLMNSAVQNPLKETILLTLRIMIGVFFYEEANQIYIMLAGTPDGGGSPGVMNEGIAWITGLTDTGTGGGTGMFANIISKNCQANETDPQTHFQGYQVWQAFDCLFTKVLGATNPTTTTGQYAFATSMLMVIAAGIFSATTGVLMAILGLSFIISMLLILFRAVYLVLMAYMCIGFMAIFAPLFGPLLFFDSKFLTEKFLRWLGTIIAAMFQPVFVIGFLGLMVTVDDILIEGDSGQYLPGCTLPTYPNGFKPTNTMPPQGWGQDGSGVCSFTDLFNQGQAGNTQTVAQSFAELFEHNSTIVNWNTNADVSTQDPSGNPTDPPTALATAKTNKNELSNSLISMAGSIDWSSATRLKQYVPVKQLLLTLMTLIFVTFAMKSLLEELPDIAARMTIAGGANLIAAVQLPMEGVFSNMLGAARASALNASKGKRALPAAVHSAKIAAQKLAGKR